MRRGSMSEKEKAYFIAFLFPIFWPFIPALLLCDLCEAIGKGCKALWRRFRKQN